MFFLKVTPIIIKIIKIIFYFRQWTIWIKNYIIKKQIKDINKKNK